MTEEATRSSGTDGAWWREFREALLDEGLGQGEDRIDLAPFAEGMNELVARWFEAGPGKVINERLDSIDRRLAGVEALLETESRSDEPGS